MRKTTLTTASFLLMAILAPLATANQLYADGSAGIAEAEAGDFDTSDNYVRIGAGVTLTEQFSAEAGFWDFGSSRDSGVRISADALYAAIKASTPIGNNLNLFGRLGLLRWESDVGPFDDDGHDLIFGGGVDFQAGPGRVGFELHFTDLDDVDIRTLGVSYSLPIQF